ncbi:MAG: hypothetical protein KC910_13655, partial [Candidatus Eremiobacteraeota bacterium]|nr:hypothetical protein [Candidatus Eremiobacteraeota bacterium]
MIFSSPEPVGNNHLCPHLGKERIRFYTGVGAEYAYICPACAQALRADGLQPQLVPVSKQLFESLEEDMGHDGVVGSPP